MIVILNVETNLISWDKPTIMNIKYHPGAFYEIHHSNYSNKITLNLKRRFFEYLISSSSRLSRLVN